MFYYFLPLTFFLKSSSCCVCFDAPVVPGAQGHSLSLVLTFAIDDAVTHLG